MAPFAAIVCQKCHFSELVSFLINFSKNFSFWFLKKLKKFQKSMFLCLSYVPADTKRSFDILYVNKHKKQGFFCLSAGLGRFDLLHLYFTYWCIVKYLLPIINKLKMQKNTIQAVHHYLYLQLFFYQYG